METCDKRVSMEMGCMFFGESEKAFYKLNDIQKCRTMVKPFYPLTTIEYAKSKDKKRSPQNKMAK